MRCVNCGVEMIPGAAFCPGCGKPVDATAVGAPIGGATTDSSSLPANVAGALCYLIGFVTGVLFLILKTYRNDRFVRFHAWQSVFLSVLWLVVAGILGTTLAVLPGILFHLMWLLHSVIDLAFFLLWLFLMYRAYRVSSSNFRS